MKMDNDKNESAMFELFRYRSEIQSTFTALRRLATPKWAENENSNSKSAKKMGFLCSDCYYTFLWIVRGSTAIPVRGSQVKWFSSCENTMKHHPLFMPWQWYTECASKEHRFLSLHKFPEYSVFVQIFLGRPYSRVFGDVCMHRACTQAKYILIIFLHFICFAFAGSA